MPVSSFIDWDDQTGVKAHKGKKKKGKTGGGDNWGSDNEGEKKEEGTAGDGDHGEGGGEGGGAGGDAGAGGDGGGDGGGDEGGDDWTGFTGKKNKKKNKKGKGGVEEEEEEKKKKEKEEAANALSWADESKDTVDDDWGFTTASNKRKDKKKKNVGLSFRSASKSLISARAPPISPQIQAAMRLRTLSTISILETTTTTALQRSIFHLAIQAKRTQARALVSEVGAPNGAAVIGVSQKMTQQLPGTQNLRKTPTLARQIPSTSAGALAAQNHPKRLRALALVSNSATSALAPRVKTKPTPMRKKTSSAGLSEARRTRRVKRTAS